MEFNSVQFLTIVVNGISFIAAFAAIAAAVIMYQVTKKFGSGIKPLAIIWSNVVCRM
jgi:hypothetical protein